jgi:hypothetical protein
MVSRMALSRGIEEEAPNLIEASLGSKHICAAKLLF